MPRAVVYTIKPIKKGEELVFDYGWEPMGRRPLNKCYCGTAKCRMFIEDWASFDPNDPAAHRTGTWQVSARARLFGGGGPCHARDCRILVEPLRPVERGGHGQASRFRQLGDNVDGFRSFDDELEPIPRRSFLIGQRHREWPDCH